MRVRRVTRPRSNFTIGSYTVTELVYESKRTRIYRAVKGSDKYVLKTVKSDSPSPEDLASLRHEYAVLKDIHIDGVVRAVQLESFGNGLALVLVDFENGLTLRQVCHVFSVHQWQERRCVSCA
jgi:hypothetical protein